MSSCKYAFYKDNEKYYPHLYCQVDDKWCIYVKKCEKVEKFIPIKDNIWEECGKYIMEKRKEIPEGAYFVQTSRPNRHGNLLVYVAMDNKVERIQTDLKELKQEYVYLKKTIDGYKVSLEPFKEEELKRKVNDNITIYVNEELATERKEKRGRKKKPVEEIKEENE